MTEHKNQYSAFRSVVVEVPFSALAVRAFSFSTGNTPGKLILLHPFQYKDFLQYNPG
ncbi:hypothetical protein [uncultured Draconibacterium sp.]|uniref:hypothetical protein n=1 Tax=uncultured Draconibacterium sp. TaxID=1573823 RepID=UPI0029C7B960|nr:hypothetical protein [uncultured Draconibacterium sp.]